MVRLKGHCCEAPRPDSNASEAWLSALHSRVLRILRKRLAHHSNLPGCVKVGLQRARHGSWIPSPTDKDGGFCLIQSSERMGIDGSILARPCYEEVSSVAIPPTIQAFGTLLFQSLPFQI